MTAPSRDPGDYPYVYLDERTARGGQACRIWAGGEDAGQRTVIVEFYGGGLQVTTTDRVQRGQGRVVDPSGRRKRW